MMKKTILIPGVLVLAVAASWAAYSAGREIWPLRDRIDATVEASSRCPDSRQQALITLTNNSRATVQSVTVNVAVSNRNYSTGGEAFQRTSSRILAPGQTFEFCAGPHTEGEQFSAMLGDAKIPEQDKVMTVTVLQADTNDTII